ncbi:hypothetical protein ACIGN6_32350 [Streptomyces sp. NPDC053792]|uniref:hypothetical protein n=1 Tax=Streptomyces sp. NPDC053792 TaxID=3365716 RepID=UPI0037D8C775
MLAKPPGEPSKVPGRTSCFWGLSWTGTGAQSNEPLRAGVPTLRWALAATPDRDAAGLYVDYSSLLHTAATEPLAKPGDSDDNETVKADENQLTFDDADKAEAADNGDGADLEPPGAQAS